MINKNKLLGLAASITLSSSLILAASPAHAGLYIWQNSLSSQQLCKSELAKAVAKAAAMKPYKMNIQKKCVRTSSGFYQYKFSFNTK